ERGVRRTGRDRHAPAAAFGVEARGHRNGLDQRRLAAAVLAREERHARVELQLIELSDRRDGERVHIEALDLVSLQDKRADKKIVRASRTPRHPASRLAAVLNSRHGIALYGRTQKGETDEPERTRDRERAPATTRRVRHETIQQTEMVGG